MKKIALLVAAMAVSSLASAQLTLSGSFNAHNDSYNNRLNDGDGKYDGNYLYQNDLSWEFAPSIGYIFEDYEAGVNLYLGNDITTRRNIEDNLYDSKDLNWGLGVYGRRYFGLTDNLSVFAELSADFSMTKSTIEDNDNYDKYKFFDLTLTPGLSYDLNEHWSLESYFNFLGIVWNNTWSDSYDKDGKFIGDGDYESNFDFSVTSYLDSALRLLATISFGITYTF